MRFLVVGVPFHSLYLRDAADKVIYQDLNGEELWTAEGFQVPMYGGWSSLLSYSLARLYSRSGPDFRADTGSLMRSRL